MAEVQPGPKLELGLETEPGQGQREEVRLVRDWVRLSQACCTFGEVSLFQQAFRWVDLRVGVVLVLAPLVGDAGAVDPWVDRVAELHSQSQAMLEGGPGVQGFHNGFVEAAGLAATAAVRGVHKHQSVSIHHSEGSGEEADQ